jgi:hypothetical protein
MKTLWKFTLYPRGSVDLVPLTAANGRLYVLADYSLLALNLRWGYYYFKQPVLGSWARFLFPERGWVKRFVSYQGLLYVMMIDRFARTSPVVFDPEKQQVIQADAGPLFRGVKYIFTSGVKVERCYLDGKYREGVSAHLHHEKTLLWTSTDRLRPAIKYTKVMGDILQVNDTIVVCQNYFSRKRHMPAGYSITAFHYRTGSIVWKIESYTYSHRLFPFAVVGDNMFITGGGHKDGFFRKIDLVTGKTLVNEPFDPIDSGVAHHEGVFFFGAGGEVIALKEEE